MISLEALKQTLERSVARSFSVVPRGHIRVETGLLYPDGSAIDVFFVNDRALPNVLPARLSDLGQTMSWLLHLQVKPWMSKKRKALLDAAIKTYGVSLQGGALELVLTPGLDLSEAVLRLAQACLRMSDLMFTRRSTLQSTFDEELEEIIADTELTYEAEAVIPGKFGPVTIDFLVYGRTGRSAILGLSSTPTQAHTSSVEVFRRWFDLESATETKITIYDDTRGVYRDEDLRRIAAVSTLIPASNRVEIVQTLAA